MKVFFIGICLLFNLTFFDNKLENQRVSLTAEVVEIRKSRSASGTLIVYHYVKLRVLNVCDGDEKRSEIIVAFVSLSTEEVNDLEIGDVICLRAKKTDEFKKNLEEYSKSSREKGEDTSNLNEDKVATHYGGEYIKNCQCYK